MGKQQFKLRPYRRLKLLPYKRWDSTSFYVYFVSGDPLEAIELMRLMICFGDIKEVCDDGFVVNAELSDFNIDNLSDQMQNMMAAGYILVRIPLDAVNIETHNLIKLHTPRVVVETRDGRVGDITADTPNVKVAVIDFDVQNDEQKIFNVGYEPVRVVHGDPIQCLKEECEGK